MNYLDGLSTGRRNEFRFSFICQGEKVDYLNEGEDFLSVSQVSVREEISSPYVAEIHLLNSDSNLLLSDFVDSKATLSVTKSDTYDIEETRDVTGIITEFEFVDVLPGSDQFLYRAVLRPEMTKLERTKQNQIYGTDEKVSVVDVAVREITGSGAQGYAADGSPNILTDRLDISTLSERYPKRDYIVQYNESDFSFVSRSLEHWGIFYFFRNGAHGEEMVLADDNAACPHILPGALRYAPPSGMNMAGEETVFSFRACSRPLPNKVIVRDYNDELPHVTIEAEATVNEDGHGVVSLFGENVRTPSEADMVARIRAEEIAVKGLEFHGESDCPHMAAGHVFRLTDHPRDDFNREYLVVRVNHKTHAMYERSGGQAATRAYRNTFVAIPVTTPFRPERKTARPKVSGLMNARVDASGSGVRAELDEEGRYSIRMPFDSSGRPDGMASRRVRMAQPYAGMNSGMHFPLLKGTDVTVACYEGNPDRPLITGAVPNSIRKSPVTSATQNNNVIRSTSGNVFELADSYSGSSPSSSSLGHNAGPEGAGARKNGKDAATPCRRDRPTPRTGTVPSAAPQAQDQLRHMDDVTSYSDADTSGSSWMRMYVSDSDTDSGYSAYLRIGDGGDSDLDESDLEGLVEVTEGENEGTYDPSTDGSAWFEVSDGNRLSVTTGDRRDFVGGDWYQEVQGDLNIYYDGDRSETTSGSLTQEHYGSKTSYFEGTVKSTYDATIGSYYLDNKLQVQFGYTAAFNVSIAFSAALESLGVAVLKQSVGLNSLSVHMFKYDVVLTTRQLVAEKFNIAGFKSEVVGLEFKTVGISKVTQVLDSDTKVVKSGETVVTKASSVAELRSAAAELKSQAVALHSRTNINI